MSFNMIGIGITNFFGFWLVFNPFKFKKEKRSLRSHDEMLFTS